MNILKKQKKGSRKSAPKALCRFSFMIFRIGLPIILLYLCAFLSLLLSAEDIPSYILAKKYYYMLEHIIMSATLIVVGGLAVDLAERHTNNSEPPSR
ncbi:MAG: hypothetical protein J6A83_06110 [Clostridia bacterium]|nr:hypothetical protein [Clostridia bacterium]